MFDFQRVQDNFPNEKLELKNGKIYLNEFLIQTRWPTEQELQSFNFYHGKNTDDLYFALIIDDIQMRIDVRQMGFEQALEESKKRLNEKFGSKKF